MTTTTDTRPVPPPPAPSFTFLPGSMSRRERRRATLDDKAADAARTRRTVPNRHQLARIMAEKPRIPAA